MAREHEGSVQFFGVAWKASEQQCREYVSESDVPYPNGLDRGEAIFRLYRVSYQPVTVLVTRSGRIFERIAGAVTRDRLASRVQALKAAA